MSKSNFKRRRKERRTVIYYTDELHDEFSTAVIEQPRRIDGSYPYLRRSLFRRFTHFFWYRVVAMPLAWLYTKCAFRHKVENAEVLKPYRESGYFLFGNHTQDIGDALMPSMIDKRKDKYVIVHPNNVTIPVIGAIAPSLGALPLPDDRAALRNFLAAIETRLGEKKAIVIYPEAHIWPYYTGIRPFPDASFQYPLKYGVPTFAFTNTYQKRRRGSKPRIVTYIDGPFLPDETLPPRDRRRDLRDRVYAAMCARAARSDCVTIQYIKKETEHD